MARPKKDKPEQASEVIDGGAATTTVAESPVQSPAAVSVHVELPNYTHEDRIEYWCGIMPGAPIQGVAVGGQDFPRETQDVVVDKDSGETIRTPKRGTVAKLTAAQIERIKYDLQYRFVRQAGTRFEIISTYPVANRRFLPRVNAETDVPLAKYLYMIRVDGRGESVRAIPPVAMAG